ncbi:MAG: VOC family protein [Blastocatellia bacterium]|nr:VOC family protein [Blastocatellia bacterium]
MHTLKPHIALNVRDITKSIAFYQQMFGIEPCKVRSKYAKFDVQNPQLNLTLNQVPFTDRGALSHLGIQVATTQDVLAVRERWIESGLTVRDEMQTNCCFAIQDKSWVQDPDGNEWEVFVVLEDNLPEKNSSLCCGTETTGSSACSVPAPIGLGHKNKH